VILGLWFLRDLRRALHVLADNLTRVVNIIGRDIIRRLKKGLGSAEIRKMKRGPVTSSGGILCGAIANLMP
jgi:hypothetical protein